jgi:stabilization protein
VTKNAKVYDYETVQIPLIASQTNRSSSASKDAIFYNGLFDVTKDEGSGKMTKIAFQKRGAFVANTTVFGSGGAGRGIYYWSRSAKTYTVIATKLYSNTTELQTLTTATGKVWFEEATGSSDVLILCDGTKMYTISTSDVVTEITDGDLPASPITPVSLDGYVFVIKSGTDEIYNSDVDAPTAWTASSFLSAEMFPDNLVALARQVNYVVGFGSFSCEFFYDNENPSGSPLRRQDAVAIKMGLAARDSLAQTDRRLIFVGQTKTGDPGIWVFDALTPQQVSDEYINRILTAEGSSLPNATGWITKHKGHTLYVLLLTSRVLVYDMDQKIWCGEWSITNAGAHAVLPFKYATEGANNTTMALHNTDGKFYKLDPDLYQDTAGAILCWIITNRYDFGNNHWKRIFRVELVADRQSSGTVSLEFTDDDYQTWSTARTLDLTIRPYTKSLGVTRRRAFRIKHTTNADFRAEALEFDFNDGIC